MLVKGAPNATAALISGEVDVCTGALDTTLSATAAGADLVVIGSYFNRDSSQPIASADIRAPQDLKGKKVIANRPNSQTTRFTLIFLKAYGLVPEDVKMVDIGNGTVTDRVNTVLSGNAAATLVTSPVDAVRAVQKGAVILLRANQLTVPDRMGSPITVSRARLTKQRDVYVRFMKAMYAAVTRMPSDEPGINSSALPRSMAIGWRCGAGATTPMRSCIRRRSAWPRASLHTRTTGGRWRSSGCSRRARR